MERKLNLYEMSTISKASKVFGKCVNEMIAHTSIFNSEVPQHSFSYKVGGVGFDGIVAYTRINETPMCNCNETGVVTCNITLPKYTKRKLKWFIANIVSNDGLCSGRKLRATYIKWASKKMWDGLGRHGCCVPKVPNVQMIVDRTVVNNGLQVHERAGFIDGTVKSKNKKYIEFEVYKFRVTPNKDGSYKLQAYINILSN